MRFIYSISLKKAPQIGKYEQQPQRFTHEKYIFKYHSAHTHTRGHFSGFYRLRGRCTTRPRPRSYNMRWPPFFCRKCINLNWNITPDDGLSRIRSYANKCVGKNSPLMGKKHGRSIIFGIVSVEFFNEIFILLYTFVVDLYKMMQIKLYYVLISWNFYYFLW